MKIKRIVASLKAKYWHNREKIVSRRLLGVTLSIIEGTIRKEDYDDAWFYLLAKHSSRLFDIGCNIGQTAIIANLAGSVQRIVLVDPNPQALIKASRNLLLNKLANNCSFYNAFVSDTNNSQVKFYSADDDRSGSIFSNHAKTATLINSFSHVSTITLDYLIDYYKWVPDLVKIDVEGAEMMVLRGAARLASHLMTRFLIEMHVTEDFSMEENGNAVIKWANENGHKVYFLKEGIEIQSGKAIANRGRCHLLVQPGSWSYPEYLEGVAQGAPLSTVA